MMQYFIPLIWILGVSGFFVVIFDKKIEECIPISIISSVNIMILTGFFKKLSYGFYISLLMILIFIITASYKIYEDRNYIKTLKNNFLTIGLIFFVALYIYIMFMHRFTTFKYWDEFMHWGFMTKESFRINAFYSEPESFLLVHKDYPPFSSVLEVLWCKLSGNYYSEPFTFRAMSILTLSFIFPIFKNLSTRNKHDYLKGFIFILMFLLLQVIGVNDFFPTFIDSIYTDFLLGSLCAFGIHYAFSSSNFEIFETINLGMVFVALILTKQMGLPLFLLILFMLVLKFNKPNKKKIVYMSLLLIVMPIAYYLIWNKYIDSLNISGQFSLSQINVSQLLGIIKNTSGKQHQIEAYNNFIVALLNRPVLIYPIKLNYILSFLLLTFLITLSGYVYKVKDYLKYSITYLLGSVGYGFAMMLLYIFSFNDYEGPLLASYERYMATYIYIGFLLLIFMLFEVYSKSNKKLYHYALIFVLVFSFVQPINAKKLIPQSQYDGYLNNPAYTRLFEVIEENDIIYKKIMLVSQYTSEIGLVAQYSFPFNKFQSVTLGKPKYEGDINAWDISIEDFKNELKKYDYIYIFNSDDPFYYDYWVKVTDIELLNNHTYKIENINDELKLIMID